MFLTKPLTNKEIAEIEKRVDEILETLKICDDFKDADVIANLQAELNEINAKLDRAVKIAEQEELREKSGLLRFKRH